MADDAHRQELFFTVPTLLGFSVRVTRAYWQRIVSIKHPTMAGQETLVQESLRQPEEVRVSRSDATVYLFYRTEHPGRLVAPLKRVGDFLSADLCKHAVILTANFPLRRSMIPMLTRTLLLSLTCFPLTRIL